MNNAGFPLVGFGEDLLLEEYRKQLETNFFGNVAMTKAMLPVMREQKSGHIIQVTSVAGRAGQPMLSAYSAFKFALEGFSESLRIETHSLGIRVAIVEPGAFDTDIWARNLYGKKAQHPSSPNRERSRRLADFVKNSARSRRDAREVARLIVSIAKNLHPRLRYIVGVMAGCNSGCAVSRPGKPTSAS